MIRTDMHIHTCASDGTWDVNQLKSELKKRGISLFSITDHDDMSGIEPMQKALEDDDSLCMIPGVEMTATYEGREYHLTAYGLDRENKDLIDFLTWCRQERLKFNQKYMEEFMFVKYPQLSLEDYNNYEYDRHRGGWKSLNYMIEQGIHKNINDHFADIAQSGLTISFKSPEEVMKVAKSAGATVFLAHPSYHYRGGVMPKAELGYWREVGIDGIECYSPYNGLSAKEYVNYCHCHGLLISGGSDCHGDFTPGRELGEPFVTLNELNLDGLLDSGGKYGI